MEKSVALFYFKNISKKFEKVCKNLLTNEKKCVIIVSQGKRKAQKRKNEVKKMKILKNILNWFMLLLGAKSELTDEMVENGVVSFEGQGRDKFGK